MKKAILSLLIASSLMLSSASVYAYGETSQATQTIYKPGVTVAADENSPTGYTATFVYKSSAPDLQKVVLYSDTFMLWDQNAPQYTGGSNGMNLNSVTTVFKSVYGHLPEDYKDTYWPGGGSASSKISIELTKVPDSDVWYTQVPLMSGAFVYNYEITKNGVTTSRLDDPANPALVNTATGVRSLSSMVYVPYNAEKQGTGEYRDRSLELPRTDGRKGAVQTITYPASDGTNRGMTVYLPYGYDKNSKIPYNVLYINMGNSGDQFGNELRWMNEGALPNIVDNLVAQGKEPFVAVSMNYQDWGHSWTRIEPDVLNNVIPFVEANYNVSKDRSGRGYAGLSAGAGTTARFYLNHPDVFSQFGIWSNGVNPTAEELTKIAKYNDSTMVHIALGKWDYVTAGRSMDNILTANGIKHMFTEIPGGHDWELWQLMFAKFAKDYLWKDIEKVTAAATLTGKIAVNKGETFNLKYGLEHITRSVSRGVYAQDVTVNFDSNNFEFIGVESLNPSVEVVNQTSQNGTVRIIIASLGQGVTSDGDLLNLKFKPKADLRTPKDITLSYVSIAGSNGEKISLSNVGSYKADINKDGYMDIGDLGIIAPAYGKTSSSSDWSSYKKMDFNNDNKINIVDLVTVAQQIN